MGRGGQQQQVLGVPGQLPAVIAGVDAGHGLRQLVAGRLARAQVAATVAGQLVGLVEDNQLIGRNARFLQPRKHPFTRQRVDADDDAVAAGANEGIGAPGVLAADNREGQVEQHLHLALPVAHQPSGRYDQHAGE